MQTSNFEQSEKEICKIIEVKVKVKDDVKDKELVEVKDEIVENVEEVKEEIEEIVEKVKDDVNEIIKKKTKIISLIKNLITKCWNKSNNKI